VSRSPKSDILKVTTGSQDIHGIQIFGSLTNPFLLVRNKIVLWKYVSLLSIEDIDDDLPSTELSQ